MTGVLFGNTRSMRRLGGIAARGFSVALAVLACAGTALAQGPATPASKNYATAYLIVGFFIALGLIVVLSPTKRSKPD
jgi:hypothetical protein